VGRFGASRGIPTKLARTLPRVLGFQLNWIRTLQRVRKFQLINIRLIPNTAPFCSLFFAALCELAMFYFVVAVSSESDD
jgi:hypothetical protein